MSSVRYAAEALIKRDIAVNIERFRFVAEIVALTAIAASLMAVVYELRQTQAALVSSTYQARAFDAIAVRTALADSDHLLPLLVKTDSGCDQETVSTLNAVDRIRIREFLFTEMFDLDNEFYQYEHGFLDPDFFENAFRPRLRWAARRWRSMGIRENRQSFVEFTDELLAESDGENPNFSPCS